MKAPRRCPMCGEQARWIQVDKTKKGFSVGKAVAGDLLFGHVGLVAGALGKKKSTWCCGRCGFTHEYDGYSQSREDRSGVQFKPRQQRCPNCGNFVQPGSNFCSVCGASLRSLNDQYDYSTKDYWENYPNKSYLENKAVQPAIQQPQIQQPTMQQPTIPQPTIQQPTIQRPAIQQPPVQQQVVQSLKLNNGQ